MFSKAYITFQFSFCPIRDEGLKCKQLDAYANTNKYR